MIPLSGTPPPIDLPYVCKLAIGPDLPAPFTSDAYWAKADMLATVAFRRLDLFRTSRDFEAKRRFLKPKLSDDDLERVRQCVLSALGMRLDPL